MSHVSIEDLRKRYREMNTALKEIKQSGSKSSKSVSTIRGYAWALYNQLSELGISEEPPAE